VVQCNNREKVLLASHQLIGPAADWWDTYIEAHEEPNTINWNEFKMPSHSHHIPQGVIKLRKEFQELKQGSVMVSEYVTCFTQLSRYPPNDVDTDEKKQECFLNGLDDGLAYALEACDFKNFQTMVDRALVLKNRRELLSCKCKQEHETQQSTNSRPHININPSPARPLDNNLCLLLDNNICLWWDFVFCWILPFVDIFYLIGILGSSTFDFHLVNMVLIIWESNVGAFQHLTLL
jgi:hypothetical protein